MNHACSEAGSGRSLGELAKKRNKGAASANFGQESGYNRGHFFWITRYRLFHV
jgi:hypothetical protein